ncbi:PcfJ domain-containing protein [uncultured Oscillibacter sp.]|uniref:PcfJ domain-containing protein n=1 Tax=uncultured Oscillibacter sp. TaxID=876091 RepID=UPI002639D041|nr:PcfJ domain-containing protein [uncultured Oscillibacter sp.]
MERVAKLVSRKPPEGLTDWAPVRDALELWGLVYEAVWIPDRGLEQILDEWAPPRKRKMVEIRCSCCGESRIMPWGKTDERHGGYGFLQEDKETCETALVGSGDKSVCPICGAPVRVRRAAEVGNGYFVADETRAMSASVEGLDRYLVLTGWTIQRRVYRNARAELTVLPAEAYVFAREYCRKLMGWRNSYSGNAGYFITYLRAWSEPEKWHESWGGAGGIFGLTPQLVAESCLPNCKLDVYMEMFHSEKPKYPVLYLRLYQCRPNVENLLLGGLPMVLDDLLYEVYHGYRWPEANIHGNISMALAPMTELRWNTLAPSRMLGLTREELRLGREQCWGLFLWRLFVRTKAQGERLTGEDMRNAALLGGQNLLELIGQGPVPKSIRYLLKQQECYDWADPYVAEEDCEELGEPVPGAYADVTTLLDYWRACQTLGRNLDDAQVRFPRDLIDAHDRALDQLRKQENAAKVKTLAGRFRIRRRQLAKYIFEADGLKIIPAGSQRELQAEADTLHHCVWTYGQSHAEGRTAIFFIRRTVEPGKPYYTLELDEKTLTVRQNRGLRNCAKTAAVQAFEDLWLSWVRAGARRDERGRPVLPEKKEARSA